MLDAHSTYLVYPLVDEYPLSFCSSGNLIIITDAELLFTYHATYHSAQETGIVHLEHQQALQPSLKIGFCVNSILEQIELAAH